MNVNVKFRKAQLNDWDRLYPLLEDMGLVRNSEITRKLFEGFVRSTQHCIVVANLVTNPNQGLLGYAWAQSYGQHLRTSDVTARLNDLFVLPDHRNQGIAKGLLGAVITWAQENNVRYL